jgi:chromosome segregation ATPase
LDPLITELESLKARFHETSTKLVEMQSSFEATTQRVLGLIEGLLNTESELVALRAKVGELRIELTEAQGKLESARLRVGIQGR